MPTRRQSNKGLWSHWDLAAIAAVVLLACSVLFGGASRDHALRLALVELAALPLIVLAGSRFLDTKLWQRHRFAVSIALATAAIPLAQLIPLPPQIWTSLPGRSDLVLGLDLVNMEPGWGTISLAPELTWRAILALLPPISMFFAVLTCSRDVVVRLIWAYLFAAVASMVLGAAQLASGGEQLYLWATTNAGSVVGFFANHNHLASLLLATLPFAMVFGGSSLRRADGNRLALWFAASFALLAIITLAVIRSKAGVILFGPVAGASLLAVWIASGRGKPSVALMSLSGTVVAALTAVAFFALPPILARFGAQYSATGRFDRWPTVLEAADTYLPLGSGIGTFDSVYRSVEPLAELDSTFFNQAHNEFVESWLETGWLGAALLLAFGWWFARRAWSAWRAPTSRTADLQRAATIAIAALLVHSTVDYPLRTVLISTLFAACCGLLELPRSTNRRA